MTPKITDEMRAALARQQGGPIEVEDDQSSKVYLLVECSALGDADETLREALQLGLDQSARCPILSLC